MRQTAVLAGPQAVSGAVAAHKQYQLSASRVRVRVRVRVRG